MPSHAASRTAWASDSETHRWYRIVYLLRTRRRIVRAMLDIESAPRGLFSVFTASIFARSPADIQAPSTPAYEAASSTQAAASTLQRSALDIIRSTRVRGEFSPAQKSQTAIVISSPLSRSASLVCCSTSAKRTDRLPRSRARLCVISPTMAESMGTRAGIPGAVAEWIFCSSTSVHCVVPLQCMRGIF
jgi:hypothetical protein